MYYDDIYRRLEMRDIGTAFCGNEHIFQRVLLHLFLSKKVDVFKEEKKEGMSSKRIKSTKVQK